MADRVRLTDIARAAGVGVATVSRALGDHPDVGEATRTRVRAIAQDLGYRPSVAARALRTGGFRAVSVIVPDDAWGWWEPVVRAAFEAAGSAGYRLTAHPVAGAEDGVAAVIEELADVPIDGVIIICVPDQQGARDACDRLALPAIAIDDTSRNLRFPTVSPRNRDGARTLVRHLIARGHHSIAMLRAVLGEDEKQWGEGLFIDERVAGYREALDAARIPYDGRLVIDCPHPFDEAQPDWPGLDALLKTGPRPDALFCVADMIAAPALRTLRRHGLTVPEDMSVAGFDDERAARLLSPQLTTIRQPYYTMGHKAVELLLRLIDGEALPYERHELDVELIVRGSTR